MVDTEIILDRFTRVAPLGLCFWDPVTQNLVPDGLQVMATLHADGTHLEKPVSAFPNRSGIFVFHHLPGLREIEAGDGGKEYWAQLPPPRKFVISVQDTLRRFLPFHFTVTAPQQGLYAWEACSPPVSPWPGQPAGSIPMFSTAYRSLPAGFAVVHADLVIGPKQPAAWAVLEVYNQNTLLGRGLADKGGHAAIIFPYPRITELSPHEIRPPLSQETWTIDLGVHYSLNVLPPDEPPDVPDLCAVMEQASARLLDTLSPVTYMSQFSLTFGQEIVLKTQAQSELWVEFNIKS